MSRIGIVTFWQNNYGSALQTYATKSYMESLGFQVDVLNERYKGPQRYINYIKKKLKPVFCSFKYKGFSAYYRKNSKKTREAVSCLTKESSAAIDDFIKRELAPYETSFIELENYAYNKNTVAILAGSDQIWNCSSGMINPYYFLKFAPEKKRCSFATSFGISEIPEFLKKDLKEYLLGFNTISVREKDGGRIVEELINKKVERLADPTLLMTSEQWRVFSEKSKKYSEEFILLHFIDEPNEVALHLIEQFSIRSSYDIVVFGYHHSRLNNLAHVVNYDGAPEDYVWMIDNAQYVLTDSFHTTLFSIHMGTNFCVFGRQYKQLLSQNSRINTLLDVYGYSDHLIEKKIELNDLEYIKTHDVSEILRREKNGLVNYLRKSLPQNEMKNETMQIKQEEYCSGCGVCTLVCNKNAISLIENSQGFTYPHINNELCVHCGKCAAVCGVKLKPQIVNKEAYVAVNTNVNIKNKSASGGAFSAIASYWIGNGGVVFGASMTFQNGSVCIEHIEIDSVEKLLLILGSKYVQSNCYQCFPAIKEYLKRNRRVLFGGTSCQIDALYRYLGKNNDDNLLTVDLVCHGVPSQRFFKDYIAYIESLNSGKITNFSFRRKENKTIKYEETITFINDKNNKEYKRTIDSSKSSYYKLFLLGESYRESCYNCGFASIDKPGDITVGDYFELSKDYPYIFKEINDLDGCGVSCLIVNTDKAKSCLEKMDAYVNLFKVDLSKVQASHPQLCSPMRYSSLREKIFLMYENHGYRAVDNYFKKQDLIRAIPRFIKYKILGRK